MHKEKYKNCVGAQRREKVVALKWGLESRQNIFRKQSNDSSYEMQDSYRIAYLLANQSKHFSYEEFIIKYLQHVVQEICLEKEIVLIL
jgi:hypothetical protein